MTIEQIRELLLDEYVEVDACIDRMHDVSDGDQFPVEDLTTRETIVDMLAVCSPKQVEARREAVIASRKWELEDERLPF